MWGRTHLSFRVVPTAVVHEPHHDGPQHGRDHQHVAVVTQPRVVHRDLRTEEEAAQTVGEGHEAEERRG